MKVSVPKIEEILARGVEIIVDKEHLKEKLLSGGVLRIKHGVDPTGPKIHLGRAAQFFKLRDFQNLGHKIVLIIGDFTAQIGDASDKQAMRRPLSEKEIKENMKHYLSQIGKILDMKKVEVRHNSQWLKKLSAKDLIGLAMKFTAQQVIQRRNFKERWEQQKPIGLHELDYPLLQGFDSVAVKADVELGGSDQLFNLQAGRDIQKAFGQPPQDIITLKMLLGPDGRKMSTSWGNIINIIDPPQDQFGKIMSIKDELIWDYFELLTRLPLDEVKKLPPREAKERLAKEIVSACHNEEAAVKAEREFSRVFRDKNLPSDITEVSLEEKEINVLDLLTKTKLAPSRSEAKRLVEQGGVKIGGKVQQDWRQVVSLKKGEVIQVGKRRFLKII